MDTGGEDQGEAVLCAGAEASRYRNNDIVEPCVWCLLRKSGA